MPCRQEKKVQREGPEKSKKTSPPKGVARGMRCGREERDSCQKQSLDMRTKRSTKRGRAGSEKMAVWKRKKKKVGSRKRN